MAELASEVFSARVASLRPGGATAAVSAALTIVAVVLTWPFVIHPTSTILGATGDLTGSTGIFQAWVNHGSNPFLPEHLNYFNAPEGVEMPWAQNLASFPSTGLLYVLTMVMGGVAAYGLFAMVGFVASGVAAFLVTRWCTGRVAGGLVAGAIVSLAPFVHLSTQWPHFMHVWVFVLFYSAVLLLVERPSIRSGLYVGAAAALAVLWTPYFILVMGVVMVTMLLIGLVICKDRWAYLKGIYGSALVLCPLFFLLALISMSSTEATGTIRVGLDELITARPAFFVVPPPGALWHPFVSAYWSTTDPNANPIGVGLYLGWIPLLLAVYGARGSIHQAPADRTLGRQRRAVVMLIPTALVAALCTLGPHSLFFGHGIPAPSELLWHVSPTWRNYTRFDLAIIPAVGILAGIGAQHLVVRSRLSAVAAAVLIGVVVLDLWVTPPTRETRLSVPGVYRVLKRLPGGIVAEYPLRKTDDAGPWYDYWFEPVHGKPVFGGYPRSSQDERMKLDLSQLSDPATAVGLATLGVKYVVLRTKEFVDPFMIAPGAPSSSFRLIARSGSIELLRNTAVGLLRLSFDGFYAPEPWKGLQWRWMSGLGHLQIVNPNDRGYVYELSGVAFSAHVPRSVRVMMGGRRVMTLPVATTENKWAFRLYVPPGSHRLDLLPSPPAQVLGGGDTRVASIFLSPVATSVVAP